MKKTLSFGGNILASLIGSIIFTFLVLPFLNIKPDFVTFIIITAIVFSIIIFMLFLRYIIHYYHDIIKVLHYSIQAISNTKIQHQGKESQFENECKNKLVALLNTTITIQQIRFNFKKKDAEPWAAIFLPYGENKLKLFVQSNISGQNLNPNMIIYSNRYFPSYCYYYDMPEKVDLPSDGTRTQKENYIKKRLIFSNIVLMPKGFKKINDDSCLDIQSGLGKCLRYQDQKIGILILGAKRINYFRPTDAKPISIISHKITSVIAHFKEYCPWHKMGWRDYKDNNIVCETRFSFSPEAYLLKSLSLTQNGINSEILNQYNELIKSLNSNPIKSISLCGTFNGWNSKQILLKEINYGLWETFLYLPLGYYTYRYFVEFENKQLIEPTKNWIYDINSPIGYDPEYGLYSKKFVN